MILLINYDSTKTNDPLFLQEGLFILPQAFISQQDAEDYLFSPQCVDLPFDACMIVPIESVPQPISVPHETQLWLKSTLGREECFVPVELMERRGNCDKCVFGSAFNDWEWQHED